MKRRITALILSAVVLITSACGTTDKPADTTTSATTTTTTATDSKDTSADKTEGTTTTPEQTTETTTTTPETTTTEATTTEPPVTADTPVAQHGKLSVNGANLVDKNGEVFQLRGMSTHGIAWFPAYVNYESFKTLRDDWNTNCVRIAMYTHENGGYCAGGDKENLKKLVKDGVEYATQLGMYVIIDWHILNERSPLKYKDEALKFFKEMSELYKDYDNVIYEICNEPNGTSWQDVSTYANEVIPVIRANDPDSVIIVGTPTWSQDVHTAMSSPLAYDNIMYALHFYAATHKEWLRDRMADCIKKDFPIFISEFSICDASGNGGIDYYQADEWKKIIEQYDVSYMCWNLANKNETSSVFRSDCKKTSGWTKDDLSDSGKWIYEWFTSETD